MAKELTFEDSAREKLLMGAEKVARAVKTTLGPRGRNAIIDRSWGGPKVTKDGASVAEEIDLEDRVENIGARLMREAGSLTAREAGDGSTTATVLANAIFSQGMRQVAAGENPVLLQRSLLTIAGKIDAALREMAVEVENHEDVTNIATIAANNDIQIGKMIAEALERVGEDGVCSIEEGKSLDTALEVVDGLHFDRGYLSQQFVTNADSAAITLEDPYILIMEEKVSNISQILPVLEKVVENRKPLLLIAEDVDGEALSTLVVNCKKGALEVVAVKAPGYGDRRKAILEDIAVATGGRAILKDLGIEPSGIKISDLGRARKIDVNSQTTTVLQGGGKKKDLAERTRLIRLEIDNASSDYDREKLQERLARLVGGVAVIRVGGATEGEVKERKKRFDNALSATRSAIEAGVLPGGGIGLILASVHVSKMRLKGATEKLAAVIMKKALEEPFRQLAANADVEPSSLLRDILAEESESYGYDFAKLDFCDMYDSGIIDSCTVISNALQNAVSTATMLLTSNAVITDIPKETEEEDHHHHDHEGVGAF
ncbi:MAG: chaperonin GroEL [Planctomycetia bacterium]|nr:chaperonin GroEL [Planctomycetia bacterium]